MSKMFLMISGKKWLLILSLILMYTDQASAQNKRISISLSTHFIVNPLKANSSSNVERKVIYAMLCSYSYSKKSKEGSIADQKLSGSLTNLVSAFVQIQE